LCTIVIVGGSGIAGRPVVALIVARAFFLAIRTRTSVSCSSSKMVRGVR
jgi:hypothetical protein